MAARDRDVEFAVRLALRPNQERAESTWCRRWQSALEKNKFSRGVAKWHDKRVARSRRDGDHRPKTRTLVEARDRKPLSSAWEQVLDH